MAGKFTSVSFNSNMVNLTKATIDSIQHKFYKFNGAKDAIVTYYSVNRILSGLDPGLNITHENFGEFSALVYDKIIDYHLYGIDMATVNLDIKEFGIESGDIGGTCIHIPNTIVPCVGDFFTINALGDKYLFRITDAQIDTLDNGANSYQCDYVMYSSDKSTAKALNEFNIGNVYICNFENIGTDRNCFILQKDYDVLKSFDNILDKMRTIFITTYYNPRIQSITYTKDNFAIYDPFMVEFANQTNMFLFGDEDDIYLMHMINPNRSFPLDYNKSFLCGLEEKDIKKFLRSQDVYYCTKINQMIGIFASRPEPYHIMSAKEDIGCISINVMRPILKEMLLSKKTYDLKTNLSAYEYLENIILKYFLDIELKSEDIDELEYVVPQLSDPILFYYFLMVIYCIESIGDNILSKDRAC